MNATDQTKLCKAGYTILRRYNYPEVGLKFKSDVNPHHWRNFTEKFQSKAARDRFAKTLLMDKKIIED